jgi:hypothetical protein
MSFKDYDVVMRDCGCQALFTRALVVYGDRQRGEGARLALGNQ